MSWLSDPDRLERFARYVMDPPPRNVMPREVADALNDAAERIRSLQERLTEALGRDNTDSPGPDA